MKKMALLIASILSAFQSNAHKGRVEYISLLTLSPAKDVYNHGSHASHCSHYSHNSSSPRPKSTQWTNNTISPNLDYSVKIEQDSLSEMTTSQKVFARKMIASDWNLEMKEISLTKAFFTSISSIKIVLTSSTSESICKQKLFQQKTKCIFLECIHLGLRNWYIIPLSQDDNTILRGTSASYVEVSKSEWMKKLTIL